MKAWGISFGGPVYEDCQLNYVNALGEATCTVCDFTIGGVASSNDCTHGTEQTTTWDTNVSPSLTQCNYRPSGSSCSATATGNVDIDYMRSSCSLDVYPSATVYYFAGPPLPGGNAGTMTMSFTLKFGLRTVTHSKTVNVTCP